MSTNANEQQKGQPKPEMTKLAYDFMANCYIYAAQLRAKGHHTLAERLVTQALELDYEANFIKGAFSTPEFIGHLKNGYYASAKALECLRLVAAVDIKCDGHDDLAESCETMKRMLKSSVVTMMSREKQGSEKAASNSPVVSHYEQQGKHEYAPPRRTDGGAEDGGAPDGKEDAVDEDPVEITDSGTSETEQAAEQSA